MVRYCDRLRMSLADPGAVSARALASTTSDVPTVPTLRSRTGAPCPRRVASTGSRRTARAPIFIESSLPKVSQKGSSATIHALTARAAPPPLVVAARGRGG
jgi:hypothetical protein